MEIRDALQIAIMRHAALRGAEKAVRAPLVPEQEPVKLAPIYEPDPIYRLPRGPAAPVEVRGGNNELDPDLSDLARRLALAFSLSSMQSRFLEVLVLREDVVSREAAIAGIYAGRPSRPDHKMLDVLVYWTRKGLGKHGIKLHTVRGVGFILDAENRARINEILEKKADDGMDWRRGGEAAGDGRGGMEPSRNRGGTREEPPVRAAQALHDASE